MGTEELNTTLAILVGVCAQTPVKKRLWGLLSVLALGSLPEGNEDVVYVTQYQS